MIRYENTELRPGDLALIIRSKLPENNGKLVEIVADLGVLEINERVPIGGINFAPLAAGHHMIVRSMGSDLIIKNYDPPGYKRSPEALILRRKLMPLPKKQQPEELKQEFES